MNQKMENYTKNKKVLNYQHYIINFVFSAKERKEWKRLQDEVKKDEVKK